MMKRDKKRRSVHERTEYGSLSSAEMDVDRRNHAAYNYLCRVEEAKQWIGSQVGVNLEDKDFENELSKGIILAQLIKKYVPSVVKKIFTEEEKQYRHTDNHNFFIFGAEKLGLPRIFYFGVLDCYEKKNIPNVVYCIHALAHYMYRIGLTNDIKGLSGKITFSEGMIEKTRNDFKAKGLKMPEFGKIKEVIKKQRNVGETLAYFIKQKIERDGVENNKQKLRASLLNEEYKLELIKKEIINLIKKKVENNAMSVIQQKMKTLLYEKAFNEICYKQDATVFSIRKFLFIFTENGDEIKKDLEIEELHKKILSKIKENYMQEVYIDEIECSVSLLLSNKVSIAKLTKIQPQEENNINLFPNETEEYKKFQEIFYLLQTNPKYLTKLLQIMDSRIRENFIIEKVVPLFANSNSKREEYMILKLVESLMNFEIEEQSNHTLKDTMSCRIILSYFRESGDENLKDIFLPLLSKLKNEIQCNPSLINKQLLGKEVDRLVALENSKVKQEYVNRLRKLKAFSVELVDIVEENVDNFPYYVRFYLSLLLEKFPDRKEEIDSLFFTEFIAPFLLAPQVFGSKVRITPIIRDNSALVFTFLTRAFGSPDVLDFYTPLNKFSSSLYRRYSDILERIADLNDYFQIDKEHFRVNKPVVHFTSKIANEILEVLKNNINIITEKNDYFYNLISNSKFLPDQDKYSISFYLNSNYEEEKDMKEQRQLKEMVVLLLRISSGKSLLDLLMKCSTIQENNEFERLKEYNDKNDLRTALSSMDISAKESLKNSLNEIYRKEFKDHKNLSVKNSQEFLSEINVEENNTKESFILPFDIFKEEIISKIEHLGIATKEQHYNEILNILAQDIVTLKILSRQRSRELEINKKTLNNLELKRVYLEEKTKMYEEYIQSYAERMTVKKRPSLFNAIIKKPGQESKYGTYKFKVKKLKEKDIMMKVNDPGYINDMVLYLSCDIPNEFLLTPFLSDAKFKEPIILKLDVLLRKKYKKIDTIEFPGIGLFSVEGLIHLINSKYIIE